MNFKTSSFYTGERVTWLLYLFGCTMRGQIESNGFALKPHRDCVAVVLSEWHEQ